MLAAALLVASAIGSGGADYSLCLKVYALKYGATNVESVESIMTIARGECAVFMRQIEEDAAADRNFKRLTGQSLGFDRDEVVQKAEGVAVKALLEARAAKQHP